MKSPLFTDDDLAAVDLEIQEAAAKAASGFFDLPVKDEDDELVRHLEAELSVEIDIDLVDLDAFNFDETIALDEAEEIPADILATAARVQEADLAKAAMSIAWMVPAVAFAAGAVAGDFQHNLAWLWAPGAVLAVLLAFGRITQLPKALPEFALCMHLVSTARMGVAAAGTDTVLSPEAAQFTAAALLAAVAAAISAGETLKRRQGKSHDLLRRDPGGDSLLAS